MQRSGWDALGIQRLGHLVCSHLYRSMPQCWPTACDVSEPSMHCALLCLPTFTGTQSARCSSPHLALDKHHGEAHGVPILLRLLLLLQQQHDHIIGLVDLCGLLQPLQDACRGRADLPHLHNEAPQYQVVHIQILRDIPRPNHNDSAQAAHTP